MVKVKRNCIKVSRDTAEFLTAINQLSIAVDIFCNAVESKFGVEESDEALFKISDQLGEVYDIIESYMVKSIIETTQTARIITEI